MRAQHIHTRIYMRAQTAKAYSLDDELYSLSTHSAAAYVAADADFNINCPARSTDITRTLCTRMYLYATAFTAPALLPPRYQAEALAKAGVDAYVYWFQHGPVNIQHPVKTENQIVSAGRSPGAVQ